jgi:outer membrane receptor protein involved in Fe transport
LATLVAFSLPARSEEVAKEKASARTGGAGETGADDAELDPDRELFIRNIVQSATKTVTTVQEAPSVISVVTGEEISDYGYRNILTTMFAVPGFLDTNSQNTMMPMWTVRGVTQSTLVMADGVSLFDPAYNVFQPSLRIPLENIKRIEATTTPGGVLWGANAFFGIVNIITKDAEDVNGLELALGLGGLPGACKGKAAWYCSPGDMSVVRPYAMYGKTFLGGKLKVFAHLSAELFQGPQYELRSTTIGAPPPQPNAPYIMTPTDQYNTNPFNLYLQLDGKVSYVKPGTQRMLQLAWQWTRQRWPGETLGSNSQAAGFLFAVNDNHARISATGQNNISFNNSFLYLLFRDRVLRDKIGINTRLYYSNFERYYDPAVVFPETPNVLAGVAFYSPTTAHRMGWTFDLDFQLHRKVKLLVGGEVFYEWVKDATFELVAPLDSLGQFQPDKVSVICPYYNRDGTGIPIYDSVDRNRTTYVPGCKQPFVFDSDRLVTAAYASAQYRPIERLTLDGGIRIQAAPAGNLSYSPVLLYSVAAVARLFHQWYLKLNYANGFRAPIFNNVNGNGSATDYVGDQNMRSEKSQAITTELNTKLLRNKGQVLEWDLRLDYSYNLISDRIVILSGRFENAAGTTAIHAVEFLSRLALKGGHTMQFAYTYTKSWGSNQVNGGYFRSIPNHWFTMATLFNVLKKGKWQVDVNATLRVMSAFEDPNRLPDASGAAPTSNVVFDRVAPSALLGLGARMRVKVGNRPLELKLQLYNLLNGDFMAVDPNFALAPRTEVQPVPQQSFHFMLQLMYRI